MGNALGLNKKEMCGSGVQLSDAQIKQNIDQLINNKCNTMEDLTYDPNMQFGKGYDCFNSSNQALSLAQCSSEVPDFDRTRKRYKEYESKIQHLLQNGGSLPNFNQETDELEQLQEVINPSMNNSVMDHNAIANLLQLGGKHDDTSDIEMMDSEDSYEDREVLTRPEPEDSENKINYSETSFDANYSDIKVLPFYSSSNSSEYSFRHPYVKNRFY